LNKLHIIILEIITSLQVCC